MILPTKHLPPERSLLGIGAEVLFMLERPKTVTRLWADIRERRGEAANMLTFDWFVLALNLLFALDAVEMSRGRLSKRAKQ